MQQLVIPYVFVYFVCLMFMFTRWRDVEPLELRRRLHRRLICLRVKSCLKELLVCKSFYHLDDKPGVLQQLE